MSSNKIKIFVVHKGGSCLQDRIYKLINFTLEEDVFEFARLMRTSDINKEDIVILRHPLNKLISEYYSYGWSHSTHEHTEAQLKFREKTRKQNLDEYIIHNNQKLHLFYDKAFSATKNIIKYEDIMDYPQKYLRFVLKKIDKEKIFDELWVGLKHEFEFNGKDLSEDIIAERSKSHIRNLDHLEYQKKISPATLKKLAPKTIETIKIYNTLPNII